LDEFLVQKEEFINIDELDCDSDEEEVNDGAATCFKDFEKSIHEAHFTGMNLYQIFLRNNDLKERL
jgi:DNA-binding transcriptional regulator PaaX